METWNQVSEPRALKGVTGVKRGVLLTSTAVLSGTGHQQCPQSYGLQYLEGLEGGGEGGRGKDRWTEKKRIEKEYNSCEREQYSRAMEGKRCIMKSQGLHRGKYHWQHVPINL